MLKVRLKQKMKIQTKSNFTEVDAVILEAYLTLLHKQTEKQVKEYVF